MATATKQRRDRVTNRLNEEAEAALRFLSAHAKATRRPGESAASSFERAKVELPSLAQAASMAAGDEEE